MEDLVKGELTGKILKSFYEVYNSLGVGLNEKIYKEAMILSIRKQGLDIEKIGC